MKKMFYFFGLAAIFFLSGCVVRTYPLTRDRIDQDLTGNRGYIAGKAPAEEKERKTDRTTRVFEIELHSPIKIDRTPKEKTLEAMPAEPKEAEQFSEGNRGFVTRSQAPEVQEPVEQGGSFEKYTVQKNDTLQKISKKFYGTTKHWKKIYNANKDALKSANSIRPGQSLNIPTMGMKETKENLK